jgi:hypothetical protein
MRITISLLCSILLACSVAIAQPAPASAGPFPAVADFSELQKILSEISFDEPSRLSGIEDGPLFRDVGFERYSQRTYSAGKAGDISVAVITLMDFRAAYSLLTLRGGSGIQNGPPGDAFAGDTTSVSFFQGRQWVRIVGRRAPADLLKRLALAVSNRLGPRNQKPPSLINHLPRTGYDASSIKYFPGLKSFEACSDAPVFKAFHLNFDAEITQGRYAVDSQTGTLTLLNFPTPEVGEEYFREFSTLRSNEKRNDRTYLKRAGPLVAILTGQIGTAAADRILGSISHSYAIRWIFEKPKKKGVTWGIPVRILHTVVKSILFVVLLFAVSGVAGAGIAFLRYAKRRRGAKDSRDGLGQTNSTRLRLR